MKHRLFLSMLLVAVGLIAAPGERLVAEWDFGKKTDSDVDGKFPGGFCRGNAKIVDGWLGDDAKYSDTNSGYQVSNKIHPELTPPEGFRLEATCKLNETLNSQTSMIFDNKYLFFNPGDATHHGLAFGFVRNANNLSKLRFIAYMGFADHSSSVTTKDIDVDPAVEHLFAMEYNGSGRVTFCVDGKPVAQHRVDGKGLAPAIRPAVIADRCGSTHDWLDGKIRNLKLYVFAPQILEMSFAGRAAFVRGEKDAKLKFRLGNFGDKEIYNLKFDCQVVGRKAELKATADRIGAGEAAELELAVDTAMSVGEYPVEIHVTGMTASGAIEDSLSMKLRLGPAMPPEEYPILMWGGGSDKDVMIKSGFTHDLGGFAANVFGSKDLKATESNIINTLDDYVAMGFRRSSYFTLGHHGLLQKQFPRYSREGTANTKNIEASNLEYQKIITDVAAKTAQIIADHPGCDALLINSEVRDRTSPSFGKYEPAAFEKFAGYPIPADVTSKNGPNYKHIDDFPFSHVVSESNPYLTYFRWFWKVGDGWNVVHSKINEQYHKYIHRPFWTFFDPAVRTPPVWGSGGSVDYVSHWTYAYPDPIRAAAVTDELTAMAAGRPGQKVMTMTQIICYRSVTAPIEIHPENEPAWVKDSPQGPYISIAPDALKEAVWSMISRKVDGIMFHGYGSVWGQPGNKGYVTTNPETKVMFKKVMNEVVKPLGPTLKRSPAREPKVAILESFASSVFAGRGTWGWTSWLMDSHLMLQWANLSPSVIYEEKIARDGLGGIEVLCLFHCDVLTETTYNAIVEFQKKGGIIIADEFVVPGIVPDITVNSVRYPPEADKGKALLQAVGKEIRAKLDAYYKPYSDSDNMDIITRVRTYKNADYLFLINDRREYGDYLGPWKRTMEKGLPNSGVVTLRRKAKTAAVYDVLAHKKVNFKETKDGIMIPQIFDSNGGRLLLALEREIKNVGMKVSANGKVKSEVTLDATVYDTKDKPVEGLIPIDVTITTPSGKVLDGSGAACAVDGKFSYSFVTTEEPGKWQVRVTELASGKYVDTKFVLK
ncbi:MAG: hypothetical protein IJS15_15750 [Victivallales bacterium]|nr:hypothetical protein [Victivallales bacterium]